MTDARPSGPGFSSTGIRVPDHVVFRSFGRELVLLNLHTRRYHGLNESGGKMLEALSELGDVALAADKVAAQYGAPRDQVQADLLGLCEQLAESGLIERVAG